MRISLPYVTIYDGSSDRQEDLQDDLEHGESSVIQQTCGRTVIQDNLQALICRKKRKIC